jgi:rhodanese-related sulfurtransferase
MLDSYPTQIITDYFRARAAAYMSPMGLKALLDRSPEDIFIVDVRSPHPRVAWRIPGSVVIPASEMQARYAELPKDKLILLYCWDTWCSLAATAALTLLEQGYRVKELHGGVAAWEMLGLPQQSSEGGDRPIVCIC